MIGHEACKTLSRDGLQRFQALQAEAIDAVTDRLFELHASTLEPLGERGRETCRDDLAFHLELLRPVLEFGLRQPMVDYLRWAPGVLESRNIPVWHLDEALDWLEEFFSARMGPNDGAVVAAAMREARSAAAASDSRGQTPPHLPCPWPEAAAFEAALLSGDQREALAVVNRCLDTDRTLVETELHVIQPALYHIGEQWQSNQVSVAQEHLATAIAQSVMTIALVHSLPVAPIGKRVLLACVEGNYHAVGLRMVADAFHFGGWDVQYLGANVPTSALVKQVEQWQPDLVALSVAFPQQLQAARRIIKALHERFGTARPAVIVGGLAINRFKPLADAIGADASAVDAEEAVTAARRFMASEDLT
jgi:methanogenic corrinoid protein MtbC1